MKKVLNAHTQFKPSIFKEGMRQIKILGIAYTVICVIVSIILALDEFPFKDNSNQHNVIATRITGAVEDLVVWLLLFSAAFIFGTSVLLFRFLRSHQARDFYCSTPNSICTIWLGFVTSIMTWAAIGVAVANIIMLPFILISDVKYFQTWLLTLIGILAIDLLACGIMSLANALTGRIIPMLITAAAILLLPASIYMLATASFDEFFSRFDFVVQKVTNWEVYYGYRMEAITSAPLIFGCLLLGLIYLALAALFMTVRTGDAVGKPFVNRAAYLISLLSVSLNMTSLAAIWLTDEIASAILWNDVGYIMDEIIIKFIVSLLAVGVSFWAANVILTFDIKKSHRMFKYLPIPIVLCAAVFGIGFAVYNAEFHITPTADEIKSFTLVRNDYLNDDLAIYRMRDTYGRVVTENYKFSDKKVIDYVANEMDMFIEAYENNFRSTYSSYSSNWEPYKINIKLNLKDGRSITRAIPTNDAFLKDLVNAIENDSEYMEKFFAMPDAQHTNICVTDAYSGSNENISDEDTVKLYECFSKEFSAMPAEKRREYLKSNLYNSYNYEDFYYEEVYYDEECGNFVTYPEEAVYSAHQAVSGSDIYPETQAVSDSDIHFVISDLTEEQGEYHATMLGYNSLPSFGKVQFMLISIDGYKDGKLYASDNYFDQRFVLTPELFPETCSLLTKICNGNMKLFLEIPDKLNIDSSFDIDAYYYNGNNMLNMQYNYIFRKLYYELLDYHEQFGNNSYFNEPYYFYNNTDDEFYPNGVDELNISGKEYVQKLFDDAAKTTDIDLSKPYCKLYVSFSAQGGIAKSYPIYIQTESLVDLVVKNQESAEGDTADDCTGWECTAK